MHDAISQVRLRRAMLDVAAGRGLSLVAISHDPVLLAAIRAREVLLEDGRLG